MKKNLQTAYLAIPAGYKDSKKFAAIYENFRDSYQIIGYTGMKGDKWDAIKRSDVFIATPDADGTFSYDTHNELAHYMLPPRGTSKPLVVVLGESMGAAVCYNNYEGDAAKPIVTQIRDAAKRMPDSIARDVVLQGSLAKADPLDLPTL